MDLKDPIRWHVWLKERNDCERSARALGWTASLLFLITLVAPPWKLAPDYDAFDWVTLTAGTGGGGWWTVLAAVGWWALLACVFSAWLQKHDAAIRLQDRQDAYLRLPIPRAALDIADLDFPGAVEIMRDDLKAKRQKRRPPA